MMCVSDGIPCCLLIPNRAWCSFAWYPVACVRPGFAVHANSKVNKYALSRHVLPLWLVISTSRTIALHTTHGPTTRSLRYLFVGLPCFANEHHMTLTCPATQHLQLADHWYNRSPLYTPLYTPHTASVPNFLRLATSLVFCGTLRLGGVKRLRMSFSSFLQWFACCLVDPLRTGEPGCTVHT
jgi:hypothetical protein